MFLKQNNHRFTDLTAKGDTGSGGNTGVIYQIKSLARGMLSFRRTDSGFELSWSSGMLQEADSLSGPWNDISGAVSPYAIAIDSTHPPAFYRTKN